MALTWNITECADKELITSEAEWPITQYMIFASLGTGIGCITEENAATVYARLRVLENLRAVPIEQQTQQSDVKNRIGLRTNASFKDKSDTAFLRMIKEIVTTDLRNFTRAYNV